ncbi:MAG: DUF1566 domain-containing protein [Gammaproteobacteria bacterium]|nr:DUF1566 domain-containing protein [Gammaproteobacteria bacterium]
MQTVNYYDVLGVSSTADDFVIKAAYKALAQRYHPDKFHGNAKDAADAEAKMRQLNEAYQVLSDPAKRREYDISFQQGAQQNQQNSQQKSEQAKQQADWAIALRFYPDLSELETRLVKIDPSLITEFRSSLLASQQYEQRQRVASQLEQNYLEDYFGNDPLIVDFARELLLAGKRDGAKELNRMLKVVGASVSSESIIEEIRDNYLGCASYPKSSGNKKNPDVSSFDSQAEWKNIQDKISKEIEDKERTRKATKDADIERIRQRSEEASQKADVLNTAVYKYLLIAGIVFAPVLYFVAKENRLEAERIAEERRQTEMRLAEESRLVEIRRTEEHRQAEIRLAEERRQAEIKRAEERQQAELKEAKRYRNNQDGTVTDSQTGLQWKRCSEGQNWTGNTCTGEAKKYDWNDATQLTSNFAGKSDWRLPTITELNTLVYCSNGKVRKLEQNGYDTVEHEGSKGCGSNTRGEYQKPTINTQAFPATPPRSFFWSSSGASGSDLAWGVFFYYGSDINDNRYVKYHARLVRGGQ